MQLAGAVYAGQGRTLVLLLPDEKAGAAPEPVELDVEGWKALLRQTDLLEVSVLTQGPGGDLGRTILRKSQRQVDQNVSWRVFRRDQYRCRYCGADDVPLTVDHLVVWEEGGPSIEENLVSSCRRDNKERGSLPYKDWLDHPHYLKVSRRLPREVLLRNQALVATLDAIPRQVQKRSR